MPSDDQLRIAVLLSIQRALLGEITSEMRAIAADWSAEQIVIRVYTDGDTPNSIRDDFDSSVVTQVVADFPHPERGDPMVSYEFVRHDSPAPLPQWGNLVFARAEIT